MNPRDNRFRQAMVHHLRIRGIVTAFSLSLDEILEAATKALDPDSFRRASLAEIEIVSFATTLQVLSGELHGDPRTGETAHVHFRHPGCDRIDCEDVNDMEETERLVGISCKRCGELDVIVDWA